MFTRFRWLALSILVLIGGCATAPTPPVIPPPPVSPVTPPIPAPPPGAVLKPADWAQLPGWGENDALAAWPAFLASCGPLKKQALWTAVCEAASKQTPQDDAAARAFFERWLLPHQLSTTDGTDTGLVTGYYEPLLFGSRTPTSRYRFPLYAVPDDMLIIDLASLYPDLKNYRLRGRVVGNRVLPYYNRAEIEAGRAPLTGKELLWVDDVVDLFFLQIQGSGRVQLESGEVVRMGYADQNGHPYISIGKKLVEMGELSVDQASMQGIKQWGIRNPEKLPTLLNNNASYVFFRELPPSPNGPPGALGVPLTGGRSLAVDPRAVTLGSPVYLATTFPNSAQPLNRLMLAQDTGGAIKGVVRADFFWGFGEAAGKQAGAMRQQGKMWVLLPKAP
ncbi:MAG: murein transglycosylase A [Burkholderiales bacterium]|nr:murein transglycosylase A [Burkholderiales bacterium]